VTIILELIKLLSELLSSRTQNVHDRFGSSESWILAQSVLASHSQLQPKLRH